MKDHDPDSTTKVRHPRRRVLVGVGVAVLVLALVAVGAIWAGNRSSSARPQASIRTAIVERTSLVSGFVLSGTLGYGDATPLGGGGGIVTKVPEAGQMVSAGQVVMEVEGAPVFLLQGTLPLWREVGPGVSGPDVGMVRSSLAGLGFGSGDSQTYDQDLSNAIGAMYAAAGYQVVPPSAARQQDRTAASQSLSAAQAALSDAQTSLTAAKNRKPTQTELVSAQNALNDARRTLDAVRAGQCPDPTHTPCTAAEIDDAQEAINLAQARWNDVNSPPDTTAEQAQVTAAQRQVNDAQSTLNQLNMNTVGPQSVLVVPEAQIRIDNVATTVGLAANATVLTWTKTTLYGRANLTDAQKAMLTTGTTAIMTLSDGTQVNGTVGEITGSATDPQTGQTTPAGVRIDIADQSAVAQLGPGAVKISFVQDEVEDTLVVPVTALMALAEGGYCVELPDGTLVPVRIGLVADTRAQVFSDDLHEGDQVVVP